MTASGFKLGPPRDRVAPRRREFTHAGDQTTDGMHQHVLHYRNSTLYASESAFLFFTRRGSGVLSADEPWLCPGETLGCQCSGLFTPVRDCQRKEG